MINITETAAKEVVKIVEQQQEQQGNGGDVKPMYLRVGVVGGGCSGFKQTLDLTETRGDNDELFEQHGVQLICDSKSHIYLDGSTIDFKTTMMGNGFVFDIPHATGRCGCGSSFSA